METNIKYNEVSDISKYISSKNEELNIVLNNIQEAIDLVPGAWEGKDSVTFVKEAKEKIAKEQTKRDLLTKYASALDTISKDYIEMESKWNEQLKRESLGNE